MHEPGWSEWVASRPEAVRRVTEQYPPDVEYRLTTTGQVGCILAYGEDGTVRMRLRHPGFDAIPTIVNGESVGNVTAVEVFGIDPSGLEPSP